MLQTWLITGASGGLSRAFAHAALERQRPRGRESPEHRRRPRRRPRLWRSTSATAPPSHAAVATAVERFGRLDVVVNNAGTLSLGMVEEFSEAEARAALETNFFGALWVSQAVTPQLRAQGAGHLIQISSIAALGGHPMTGLYSASKFALEGLSEALAAELAAFGAKLTIVEPGGYWTDLYARMTTTEPLDAYASLRAELERQWADGSVDSAPALAADALMTLADSDDPPLRLLLGSMVYDLALDTTRRRMETWAGWEAVSRAAEHAVPARAG